MGLTYAWQVYLTGETVSDMVRMQRQNGERHDGNVIMVLLCRVRKAAAGTQTELPRHAAQPT